MKYIFFVISPALRDSHNKIVLRNELIIYIYLAHIRI